MASLSMEKHKCKLCFRKFSNGKALGGHMRSHMMNLLYAPSKSKQEEKNMVDDHREISEEEIESLPSSSEDDENEMNTEIIGPEKKICMVDSEFCFGVEAADSVVLQDGESESDQSSKIPICRRSKRVRKSRISDTLQFSGYNNSNTNMKEPQVKKPKSEKQGRFSTEFLPCPEAEPVSSISDTTPEEDVAYCLMMLSRDKWKRGQNEEEKEEETEKYTKNRSRGKYRCEACNKVFRSYQALGGHRASHKRIKFHISNSVAAAEEVKIRDANAAFSSVVEEKIHECPVCYRVFSSGQALGGHKRSHVMGAAAAAAAATHVSITSPSPKPFSRFGETFIDLNLPAPTDDDYEDEDVSQIELSAVSDAEFVNPFKH